MQGSEAKIRGLETNQQRPIEDEIAPSGPGSPPRQARALRPLSAAGMPKPGGEGPIHQNVRRASIFPRPRGLRKGSVVAPKSRSRFRSEIFASHGYRVARRPGHDAAGAGR
jgi:hypothetical protein